jgi:DNA-binding transcriptional regulator YbjK
MAKHRSAEGIELPAAPAGQPDGPVSRSMILQAALTIIDRDGIDGLSMRRLS